MNEQLGFAAGQRFIEAKGAEAVAQTEAAKAAEAADFAKQNAIEARLISPEMRDLNNAAELAIYGTHGRTEGFVDPSTGEPLAKPIKGKIDEIRQNPRYGTKQADREAAADKYKQDIEALVGEGLELTQAKVVMDQRESWAASNEKHGREINKRVSRIAEQYVNNGDDREEAHTKALLRVSGMKDAANGIDPQAEEVKLKKTLKTEGIFTSDELEDFVEDGKTPEAGKRSAKGGPEAGKSGEEYRPHFKVSRYESEDEHIDFTRKFTRKDEVIDWSKLPETREQDDRSAVVTTANGDQFLLDDDKLYRFAPLGSAGEPRVVDLVRFDQAGDLPNLKLGHKWEYAKDKTTDDEVVSVEVLADYYHKSEPEVQDIYFDENNEDPSQNPFDKLYKAVEAYEERLKAAARGPAKPTTPQRPTPAPTNGGSKGPAEPTRVHPRAARPAAGSAGRKAHERADARRFDGVRDRWNQLRRFTRREARAHPKALVALGALTVAAAAGHFIPEALGAPDQHGSKAPTHVRTDSTHERRAGQPSRAQIENFEQAYQRQKRAQAAAEQDNGEEA